jgi:hypothetical protein
MAEFWLGHVALGRPSDRDRDAEFAATATAGELHQRLDAMLDHVLSDLAALETAPFHDHEDRAGLPGGDGSNGALVLHVFEELFQHLGHAEVTVDVLT